MRGIRKETAAGLAGLLAVMLLAAGCAGTPARDPRGQGGMEPAPATAGATVASGNLGGPIADLALSLVGVPYRYGSANPDQGFDCSGLVYYTYSSTGHAVPRTSREQFDAARKIPLEQAATGDLIFFRGGEILSHVAIYLGDGRFIHAPSSGGAVQVANIDAPYYQRHLIAVGRLPP